MQERNAGDLLLRYFLYASSDEGWIATRGDSSACRYLLNRIKDFPTAEEFAREVASMGFIDTAFQRLTLDIVAIYTAHQPQPKRVFLK